MRPGICALLLFVVMISGSGPVPAPARAADQPPACPTSNPYVVDAAGHWILPWCPQATGANLICIDMLCAGANVVFAPPRNTIPQNQGLVVRIRHESSAVATATWGGQPGLRELTLANTPAAPNQPFDRSGKPVPPPPVDHAVSSFAFPPRLAGEADVDVSLARQDKSTSTAHIQLLVEALSWGAARLGFGALFGDAVSRTYQARTVAGSSQEEIVLADDPRLGWEAVIGFAPYLLDIVGCDGHGRSHTGGCNYYVSPYFGIGVIGQSPGGVDSFRSLYLGLELEFASSFSVAATAVWRKVDTLAGKYVVGSPVQPGTDFTQSATGFGFGLVLNATPDFFQFDKKGGSPPSSPPPPPSPPATGGQSGAGGTAAPSPGTGGSTGAAGNSGTAGATGKGGSSGAAGSGGSS